MTNMRNWESDYVRCERSKVNEFEGRRLVDVYMCELIDERGIGGEFGTGLRMSMTREDR